MSTGRVAAGVVFALICASSAAFAQTGGQGPGAQRGGQGRAVPADAKAPVIGRARVPTSHANVHAGPGSGSELLVMVAKETVLPVIGRRGEWVQVRLSPDLRKTGIVIRWYDNETAGWMHDSTVTMLPPDAK